MRRLTRAVLLAVTMALGVPTAGVAQAPPADTPPFADVQATWTKFWTAVILGDLTDAERYLYSRKRHLFPGREPVEELQNVARQMAHCRLDPTPLPATEDEVLYIVRCEHGGERVEMFVGFRRDFDGVWRISAI